jgi:hypothetical protein
MKILLILALIWANNPFQEESRTNTMPSIVLNEEGTLEEMAEKIFQAYSQRNLKDFSAQFSEDVEVYLFPSSLLYKGKAALEKNYIQFFNANPKFKCELVSRKINGNKIVEELNITRSNGKASKSTIVYEVENELVKKMYFL